MKPLYKEPAFQVLILGILLSSLLLLFVSGKEREQERQQRKQDMEEAVKLALEEMKQIK